MRSFRVGAFQFNLVTGHLNPRDRVRPARPAALQADAPSSTARFWTPPNLRQEVLPWKSRKRASTQRRFGERFRGSQCAAVSTLAAMDQEDRRIMRRSS